METTGIKTHTHRICVFIFLISATCVSSIDTLIQGEELRDWDHLVSSDEKFRLGFFSPPSSRNRYLGILSNWDQFHKVVWVANRNNPVPDSSSVLLIDQFGKMKIEYSQSGSIVLSHVKVLGKNVSATLLDSGNFVLKEMHFDGSVERVLWQSFDYPTDTLLPGMKLGINFKTRQTWSLTSWISDEDPATGSFTFGVDPNSTYQLIVWWQEKVYWRSGIWKNESFEFAPKLSYYKDLNFSYISNENEKYFTFSVNRNKSSFSTRYIIDWKGVISENDGVAPFFRCSFNGGHFWDRLGCADENVPSCMRPDDQWFKLKVGFIHNEGFMFDGSNNMSLFDCQAKCLENCSCVAYASTNKNNNTGCEIWSRVEGFSDDYYGDLISRKIYFLKSTQRKWWIWLVAAAGLVLVLIVCYMFFSRLKRRYSAGETDSELEMLLKELGAPSTVFSKAKARRGGNKEGNKSQELLFFSYGTIVSATNDFSNANKLGEGGFGPVYKGKLEDGQEVAMKRLSKCSVQGMVEFKNEALLIAKLQHTNLVKLIGCCVQEDEKILIYEYMHNKSLDYFLFDSERKKGLDWKKRLRIIEGVIQGLLYLHKYSRLRIIHRDLKASNILLDKEMNPKISDFGMARIVGPEERQTNTKRVVGTYGYMSPEYAMADNFSTKSDVFSFGVLLLEIVSGRRNNSFYNSDGAINLVGYAWELWREGRGLELMDSDLADSNQQANMILRCIQVGLLCVEDDPVDRPSMLDVLSMIFNESTQIPAPKQPAFSRRNNLQEADIPGPNPECFSVNRVSITHVEAR